MRWTCLLLGLLALTYIPAHAGHSPPKVTLHVHVQTNGVGLSPQEASTLAIPPNGETIQVRTMPEVTELDLTGATEDNGTLRLQFDHRGSVALSAATAENQGRILVVLMNGIIIYAPIIDEQITTGELDIPKTFDPRLVALLQELAKQNVRKANKT
jgi:preprotein translocase subunit SecD